MDLVLTGIWGVEASGGLGGQGLGRSVLDMFPGFKAFREITDCSRMKWVLVGCFEKHSYALERRKTSTHPALELLVG